MFKSNHERRMRYSIRKFSVGVASVAVASLFMGSVVHATEKEGSTQAATSFNRGNGSQAEQRGELDLERDKAMKAVSEYVGKMVRDAYVKSDRKRHKNTVALVNQLGNIKNRYLNEIVHSTSKSQLQELMMKSQSEVDEAVSKFEKDSFSSSSSGSSTKPETPQPEKPKPEVKPQPEKPKPEVKPQPEKPKPEVKPQPEKPKPEVKPQPEKPKPEVKPQPEKPKPEVKPQLEKPKPEVKPQPEKPKPDNSKPQADDKKPSTTNNLSKDKQPSNQASTNEKATNKPKKSLPSTGSISNLALEIAGLLTLAGATILAKKRMK
ncbi:pneumococcal surface protein PspC, LPXTG-anchored form [Streptococcus pneumoniae]|nr:pneumococcal surface protein PspC, LPXTG-anchored form [Streptococcus pneumoniae]MDG7767166.1 pneumococcal surface protein PspC, LPXTG-anchored form [Streptococcus pneumoniae]MDG8569786.1 pneumococcal surface protein PspC, LPXTG-anchored form [Streptococcus pneumoniae]MDG8573783.1 pneumococcal surface protein PspC, LPXTG-anchored form [Streptococcus pneumoniae]MDG8595924.1 pneumococcal surface protein PspC, LPXTG-anchored form [Streptococcus pneumoniae]